MLDAIDITESTVIYKAIVSPLTLTDGLSATQNGHKAADGFSNRQYLLKLYRCLQSRCYLPQLLTYQFSITLIEY